LNSKRAFTVIELVGVLAIIAIIAAALAPNVIRRIDRAAWTREVSDLNTIGNGLLQTVTKDRLISNNLPAAVSKYLDLSSSQITTTPRGFSRVFMMDPNLTSTTTGVGALSYVQTVTGLPYRPTGARIMIISTIGQPSPSTISDSFQTIWDVAEGGKPASWTGKADDLCIKRVDLSGLFHKVCLLNNDSNYNALAFYDLNQNGFGSVYLQPNGDSTNFFVLDGTALNLHEDPDHSQNPTLQYRVIVDRDISYAYQDGRWSGDLSVGLLEDLGPFGKRVRDFLGLTCDPENHVTPQAVIDQFYAYLFGYWVWSQPTPASPSGFEGIGENAMPQVPLYRAVLDAQTELDSFTSDLIQ
jgi:hypothetical protein